MPFRSLCRQERSFFECIDTFLSASRSSSKTCFRYPHRAERKSWAPRTHARSVYQTLLKRSLRAFSGYSTTSTLTSHIWVFLPLNFLTSEYDYEAPLEKWTAILRLAHLWQFPKIKALATRKLDRIDIEPVDKAVMAREYEVDPAYSWLEQANTAIGEREEAITESEGGRLGLDAVVRLAGLRERIRKTRFEQEKNTLLQVYASPRPVSPNPSILDGGLELREEDAIVKSLAFSRPCTPRSINASPLEYLPKSPAPVRDAELHAHPADEPVPPDNTLNSPFNVSVPPHSSFGTYPSTFWSVPVPVTDSLNSAYEPTDSLEPSSFGRAKGKKGKKGKKSEEESDSIPRMWG